jgi:uncharacterized protein YbcI
MHGSTTAGPQRETGFGADIDGYGACTPSGGAIATPWLYRVEWRRAPCVDHATGGRISEELDTDRGDETLGNPLPGPADPDPRPEEAVAPSPEVVARSIADDLMAIQRDSYGQAAKAAQAHVIGDTVIVILDDLELLPNEEFLIEQGRADAVSELRESFQQTIAPTFRAAVERATGRRVVTFASHTQLEEEPRFALEVFRLEPGA